MHERFMKEALRRAKVAYKKEEVPIGCVIVREGKIVASGRNSKISDNDSLAHAEMKAIRSAQKKLGTKYLTDCVLYVTVEPCAMCAGALINARVGKLVYGVKEPKTGCCGSLYDIVSDIRMNHRVPYEAGVCADECEKIMKDFFAERRNK